MEWVYNIQLLRVRLLKHESSTPLQKKTGKIRLRSFLFRRRIPDIDSPYYRYNDAAKETAVHVVVYCPLYDETRGALRTSLATHTLLNSRDYEAAFADPINSNTIVKWLLTQRRLRTFRLAQRLGGITEEKKWKKPKPRPEGAAPVNVRR